MADLADDSLVAVYSQLEHARSLAADGEFAACREAYAHVEAQLRLVAASAVDPDLRQSWVQFMRALREEQELTAAWEQECAELTSWAEEQDVLCTPSRQGSGGGCSRATSLSPSNAPATAAAAFSVDTKSFEMAQLPPRQRSTPPGSGTTERDPDVWAPPEPLPEVPPHSNSQRRQREQAFDRHRRDNVTPGGTGGLSATKRAYSGVKARVNTGAKRGAGAGSDHTAGAMEALLDRYSGPDQDLIQQLSRDILDAVPAVSWDDIAGLEEAKEVLRENVSMSALMQELFAEIPLLKPTKGVLLFGPPGTGKTMLAKAVATAGSSSDCRTQFINVSASTLASKYRGESEKLVRFLFEIARAHEPCVVFIDEIDSLCGERGTQGEHEASRRMKTELLTQIDGIQSSCGPSGGSTPNVMLLAATNHPWALDEALRRRLEKRIYIPLPSLADREQLLRLNMRGMRAAPDVDLRQIALATEGYSGDDIYNLTKRAAENLRRRAVQGRHAVTQAEIAALREQAQRIVHGTGLERQDFEVALQRSNPSCSLEVLQLHKDWSEKFGCS